MNMQDYFESRLGGKVAYIYELQAMQENACGNELKYSENEALPFFGFAHPPPYKLVEH